jgi:hypothetical protein
MCSPASCSLLFRVCLPIRASSSLVRPNWRSASLFLLMFAKNRCSRHDRYDPCWNYNSLSLLSCL